MVVIEMRDAAYDTAFELLEEAKHNAKKTKLTLCELEDAMYDCYEASKDEQEMYESPRWSSVVVCVKMMTIGWTCGIET